MEGYEEDYRLRLPFNEWKKMFAEKQHGEMHKYQISFERTLMFFLLLGQYQSGFNFSIENLAWKSLLT